MKKVGFDRVKAMLNKISPEIEAQFENANRENAEDIVDLAKILIPDITGASRAEIKNYDAPGGGQIVDFGQKAKVIEGESGPRSFKNPAMIATKKKRMARNRKAIRDAVKAVR